MLPLKKKTKEKRKRKMVLHCQKNSSIYWVKQCEIGFSDILLFQHRAGAEAKAEVYSRSILKVGFSPIRESGEAHGCLRVWAPF